jgi:hypothetical protein
MNIARIVGAACPLLTLIAAVALLVLADRERRRGR